ncbi:hypothetical protein [uncultured Amaricoccus sp.]|uniref:hypothetical protein n=1 Tax=uncultured Amaricoccus sp. TaxID=339341 RepID=UPI002620169F|nr:hypothetical protein [uncultured Amaricoccus sp.]
MRIFERGAALAVALLLAACDPAGVSGSGAGRVTVNAGGQPVTIAAPAGFCVDARSTSVTSTGAFVLLSDCALLGKATPATARPTVGAALTASISTGGLGDGGPATQSLADLERYVATPQGRALVGRGGQTAGVRILATQTRAGVLYVLVEDRGAQPIVGVDPRFWRGFLEINGRLIAISELGFNGSREDPEEGFTLLAGFADAIQRANPVRQAPAASPLGNVASPTSSGG